MRTLSKFLGGLALCLSQAAMAVSMSGLYEVQQQLDEDSPQARDQAVQQSFVSLLQRLTGDGAVAATVLQSRSPLEFARQYSFTDDLLQVDFDSVKVNALLRESGLALWGTERPQLLIWWEQDGLQGLQLLGDGQARSVRLGELATGRGLPIRFPLADLSEQVAGDRGLDERQVAELTGRYGTDLLLQVDVVPLTTGELRATWTLYGLGEPQKGRLESANTDSLADALFARVAKNLAGRYASVPGAGRELQVMITQPDTDSLLAAERALKNFGARLTRLDAHEAAWTVTADPEQLRSQMAMQDFVEQGQQAASYRASAPERDDSAANSLVFERR